MVRIVLMLVAEDIFGKDLKFKKVTNKTIELIDKF